MLSVARGVRATNCTGGSDGASHFAVFGRFFGSSGTFTLQALWKKMADFSVFWSFWRRFAENVVPRFFIVSD
ncbi:MAG: hypothetical protein WCO00_04875 [Rhodospirillaceae bacterium]